MQRLGGYLSCQKRLALAVAWSETFGLAPMDSKHLILKEDEWLERLIASGQDHVTAYPNSIGYARDGWLAGFREAHRTCLLADSNHELVVFGSRSEADKVAFERIQSWMESRSLDRLELKIMLHD